MGMKSTHANDRQSIRHLIDSAEGRHASASDSDDPSNHSGDDDSDTSASHAYIAAQTSHGTSFSHLTREQRRRHEKDLLRPRAPDKTTPVPTLAAGLSRLRELQSSAELNRQRAEVRKAEIRTRLAEVEAEKARIQTALEELGSQLERTNQAISAQSGNANAAANGEAERGADGGRIQVRQGGLDDIRALGLG